MFIQKEIKLHSGQISDFKIECDDLSEEDLHTLAYLISKKYSFNSVYGIPEGGLRLATHLSGYINTDATNILIVDDVLTTAHSMEEAKEKFKNVFEYIDGVVIFARGPCPSWIEPIFQMWH